MEEIVRLERVRKIYRMGNVYVEALRDVNLRVGRGDFLAVLGPSGSGKSTLLNMIGCLDKPTSGNVLIDGKNTGEMNESELAEIRRRKIGFVFQQYNLIHSLNALENVALPMLFAGVRRSERLKRAKELLERVGLSHRIHHKPSELSGGEQQRVAIARALANNPDMIIGDEPTGNVDTATGDAIMDIFSLLNREEGKTIILVTHDEEIADRARTKLRMRDGKIYSE
ncbi:MAG: ABC transporter ATP-binding protein [Canidatus Methanoxibalbensis ujae]|nr:ABC transporter ATP-binding protein [Candidatus Methanoxibalbensis ujae]MCW7078761.1 ABC transporter ATP-binding protein [Candidatus Methanoxibalbensis ujae]